MRRYTPLARLLVLLLLFSAPLQIYAAEDRLDSIEIEVFLHQDGSAEFIEIWRTEVASGSENYKPLANLQDAVISNFKVIDNGVELRNIGAWNKNADKKQKEGKSGIINTQSGVELCWGIDNYGYHTYELEYLVENFAQRYSDYNGIYWQFVSADMSPLPRYVQVTVQSELGFTTDNTRVWAFGFTGSWKIEDGSIIARSDENKITAEQFVELMVRLPLSYLETSSLREGTFAEAMSPFSSDVAADLKQESGVARQRVTSTANTPNTATPNTAIRASRTNPAYPSNFFLAIGGTAALFIVLAVLTGFLSSLRNRQIEAARQNIRYQSDLTPNGDILANYWLLQRAKACDEQNLIKALFIHWVCQGYLKAENRADNSSLPDNTVLQINSIGIYDSTVENDLFSMLVEAAAGRNEILIQVFFDWLLENGERLLQWNNKLRQQAQERALAAGYIEKQGFAVFRSYRLTVQGEKQLSKLLSLKTYLSRSLQEAAQSPLSTAVWNDYLFYATLFDIREQNHEAFRSAYPENALYFPILWSSMFYANRIGVYVNTSIYHHQNTNPMVTGSGASFGGISGGGGGGMGGASGGGRR